MKTMIAVVVAGLFLIAAVAPADARGSGGGGRGGGHAGGFHGGFHGHHFHGHGFRSSVVIGGGVWLGPYWDPFWYPGYYPYYPYDPVPVATEPQTYIEQSGPAYWYYCEAAKAYYPYVRECPGGWLTVLPQAAPEPKQ
jgi:hypothetical protein